MFDSNRPIRIFHIDDNQEFLAVARPLLEGADERFTVTTETTPEAGLDRLATDEFDCVVSDYEMPDMTGLEVLQAVRADYPELPFVLFTGKGSEAVASRAISMGVTDYIQKGPENEQYSLLANRISNAVASYRARQQVTWQRTVLENMREGVYVLDGEYRLRFVNFRVSSYEPAAGEQWVGNRVSHLSETGVLSDDEVERIRNGVDRVLAEEAEDVRLRIRPVVPEPDRTLELRLTRIERSPGDSFALGTTRDITDRETQQAELRSVRAQYETLVDHLPGIGVFLFDEDLGYTLAGGGELSEVGLSAGDFTDQTPFDLFPEDIASELAEHYRAALDGAEHTFEQRFQGKHYRIKTLPVRDDDGQIITGLAVSQDVTEQKRTEQELQRQNEQLEAFAQVVSHDLRNPLTVAAGRLELVRREEDTEHFDAIERALTRCENLIEDLLMLAKSGEQLGELEPVDLATATRRCWRTVDAGAAQLVVESDLQFRADPSRFQQLLGNLLRNAVEHGFTSPRSQAPEDADVTIRVGALDDGFYVEDDGPGFDGADTESLFEMGYSTADGGTGYGLAIVDRVVDAHGWTVTPTESAAGGARLEIRGVAATEERPD
ncbi:PAS domain-containing protein [Halosimplex litoreum]|uniref:histidine kinase n=1 Tax=Halosimplex litoreum TaxID=1198301 RepID=A0A7T3FV46_9EURY|nr:PAS domain-containing protein [Halosimplex litoreum]QPV61247.1 PAS domain-containing protein [Halosimplex litoreum]